MSESTNYQYSYIDSRHERRHFREDNREIIVTFKPDDAEKAEKAIRTFATQGSIDGEKIIKWKKADAKPEEKPEEKVIRMNFLNKESGFARVTTKPGIAFSDTMQSLTTGDATKVITAAMPALLEQYPTVLEQYSKVLKKYVRIPNKHHEVLVYPLPRRLAVQLKEVHIQDLYHYEKGKDEDGQEIEKLVFDRLYSEQAENIFKQYNLSIEKPYGKPGLFSVSFPKEEGLSEGKQLFSAVNRFGNTNTDPNSPPVVEEAKYVDFSGVTFAAGLDSPNDFYFDNQWALNNAFANHINTVLAWGQTHGNEYRVHIAVLDTGVDIDHPDIRVPGAGNPNKIRDKIDVISVPPEETFTAVNDTTADGHGTAVAGVIGALTNNGPLAPSHIAGAAWDCGLFIVKISNSNNMATVDHNVAKTGIDKVRQRAYDNRAAATGKRYVMNLSWKTWNDSTLHTEIEDAFTQGVVVVAAAGDQASPVNIAGNVWPADWNAEVIAVAAHTNALNAPKRSDSNYGGNVVIAPGESIHTTVVGGTTEQRYGTSYAAGFVSSAAALCWAKTLSGGSFTGTRANRRDEIKADILNHVVLWPGDDAMKGRINTYGAVNNVNAT